MMNTFEKQKNLSQMFAITNIEARSEMRTIYRYIKSRADTE